MKLLNLSYSSLNVWHSCPTKFMMQKFAELEQAHRSSAATLIGTAVHESFQTYLITESFENAVKVLMLKYPIKLKKASTGKYHFLYAFYLLRQLINWYEQSGLQLMYINGKPAVEFKVETVYQIKKDGAATGKEIHYIGFIDAIFLEKATGEVIICDIKTSSTTASEEEEYSKYALSPQTVEYVSNFMSLLGYSDSEIKEHIDNVKVLYLIARFNNIDSEVVPIWFTKTSEDLDNMRLAITDLVAELLKKGKDLHNYYRSGNCNTFGQLCPFFPLCSSTDLIANFKLADFQEPPTRGNPFNTQQIIKTININ